MRYVGSSEARYARRRFAWAANHRVLPLVRHHAWWLLHNAVSHPLLGVAPTRPMVWFHDWTSMHLNQRDHLRPSPMPQVKSRRAWVFHNVVGHLAIGLAPSSRTFAFHDRTAAAMDVPDWV